MSAASVADRTAVAIEAMLREPTGKHWLDSGGESNRHWQLNATRDFVGEAPATVSFRRGEIDYSIRVYHWLRERLVLDDDADAVLDRCEDEHDEDNYLELRDRFADWYARDRSRRETAGPCSECDGRSDACEACDGRGTFDGDEDLFVATGLYGDGEPLTINTYNEPTLLDQTLLFTYFELRFADDRRRCVGAYVALQVHGGADVRGGYSRPRIFAPIDRDDLAMFDFARAAIECEGDSAHRWSTDDGCRWYADGVEERAVARRLDQCERRRATDDGERHEWEVGAFFFADEDGGQLDDTMLGPGDGCCPVCRSRLVGAST